MKKKVVNPRGMAIRIERVRTAKKTLSPPMESIFLSGAETASAIRPRAMIPGQEITPKEVGQSVGLEQEARVLDRGMIGFVEVYGKRVEKAHGVG